VGVLVPVLCPHCGAKVDVDRDVTQTTCRYCGTVSWVQRPEAKQQPAPPPNVRVIYLPPPQLTKKPMWPIAIPIVIAGILVPVVFLRANSASTPPKPSGPEHTAAATPPATPAPPPRPKLDFSRSGRPLVADANGDGTDDVVLWESGAGAFVAYDGKGSGALWKSEAVSAPSHFRAFSLLAGKSLVTVRDVELRVLDLASGKVARKITLEDKAVMPCRAPEGKLRLLLQSDEVAALDLADGSSKLEKKGAPCDEAASDVVNRMGSTLRRTHPVSFLPADVDALRCGGINVTGTYNYVVTDPCGPKLGLSEADFDTIKPQVAIDVDGGWLVLGRKAKGRNVAMLARVEKKKLVWSSPVSSSPAAEQPEESPERVAISGKRVGVLTQSGSGDRLAAFGAVENERQLDVALPGRGKLIAAAKNRWIVVTDDKLLAVSSKKGDITTLAE
jgi:hypothetical protein